jgi:hypothetical protein
MLPSCGLASSPGSDPVCSLLHKGRSLAADLPMHDASRGSHRGHLETDADRLATRRNDLRFLMTE